MIEARILPEKSRIALADGEVVDMPAEGALHSDVKSALIQSIAVLAAGRFRLGADTPLRLSEHEWPVPDLYLLPQALRPSQAQGPDVLLLVEVADTSLAQDLGPQAALYARFGVREYWVLDLANRRIHQHLLSAAGGYGPPQIHDAEERVEASLAAGVSVRLAELL